eukprot:95212-Hanusia_phi.AAC.2
MDHHVSRPVKDALILLLATAYFLDQTVLERGEVGTRFGRASFGILLFQDLAVVPLLVVVPLLAAGGGDFISLLNALLLAAGKAAIALGIIFLGGRTCLEPVFRFGASAKSPEAFVATILVTVLAMSTLTESLGLSDTLGAFLAGVLLAETKYRHQIEADIAPFRVALSMVMTPFLATTGFRIASSIESKRGLMGARKEDIANAKDYVVVAARVIEARNKGLPVFFGDACRPEVLKAAGIKNPKAVVVTLDDKDGASKAVNALRREYPSIQIFVRAKDAKHQKMLQLGGATAIVPELLESSLLLGGAVLLSYGTPIEEG